MTSRRQEQFNSRLKFFYDCLGGLFRHGDDTHKYAFEAIFVSLQYAMDLGEPIFDVVHHDAAAGQVEEQKPKTAIDRRKNVVNVVNVVNVS
jgi:hypothetical protein